MPISSALEKQISAVSLDETHDRFQGSGYPCNLSSLMHLRNSHWFSVCSAFFSYKNESVNSKLLTNHS